MKALLYALIFAFSGSAANAEPKPEYYDSFDPAKGFKPAQRNLTEIYLQLAGSLEEYGSPEPYLRHVLSEQKRIEDLYRERLHKEPGAFRPPYLTEAYIEGLVKNWNYLAPKLGLVSYTKDVGNTMRDAIKGTRGTGTILVDIFNKHQERVFSAIGTNPSKNASFANLRDELSKELELDRKPGDFLHYEMARRDAVSFSLDIHGTTMKLFVRLDAALSPSDSKKIKAYLISVFLDVGEMAQAELHAAVIEWALNAKSATLR